MNYNLDLSKIGLGEYKKLLISHKLLPGRRLLHEELDVTLSLPVNRNKRPK